MVELHFAIWPTVRHKSHQPEHNAHRKARERMKFAVAKWCERDDQDYQHVPIQNQCIAGNS
jgi:hypothetical protein